MSQSFTDRVTALRDQYRPDVQDPIRQSRLERITNAVFELRQQTFGFGANAHPNDIVIQSLRREIQQPTVNRSIVRGITNSLLHSYLGFVEKISGHKSLTREV